MRDISHTTRLLGLTKHETHLFRELVDVPDWLTTTEVAERSNTRRTTAYTALASLHERGLLRKENEPVIRWKSVPLSRVRGLTRSMLNEVEQFIKDEEIPEDIDAGEVGLRVYRGRKQIMRAYELLLEVGVSERIYYLQGNTSAAHQIEHIDKEYVTDFHKRFQKKKIIMETVNGEAIVPLLKSLDKEYLLSHKDRLLVVSLVADEFITMSLDLVIIRDQILLVVPEQEVVIFIRNEHIATFARQVFKLYKQTGRSINYRRMIEQILEKK